MLAPTPVRRAVRALGAISIPLLFMDSCVHDHPENTRPEAIDLLQRCFRIVMPKGVGTDDEYHTVGYSA